MINSQSKKIIDAVNSSESEIIGFLKKLVQTPSVSGEERKIAELIENEMKGFGFRDYELDSVGNVIGTIKGKERKNLLFHSHLDHVSPGDMSDPYSGKIVDGERFGVKDEVMYGRGTCDTKGSVCSMLMACKILLDEKISLNGDLFFAGTVMEESGGSLGTKKILENYSFDTAIIGEPTDLNLALGHRGGAFLYLKVKGLSGHVGRAENCVNALEKAIDIINETKKEVIPKLRKDKRLGDTTLAFTNIKVKPGFVSIIPDESLVQFDLRYTPKHKPDQIISEIKECINDMRRKDSQIEAEVGYMTGKRGNQDDEYRENIPPFYTPLSTPQVELAQKVIKKVTGRAPENILWPFATDGAFISKQGSVTLGIGPGDYRVAHSINEHVRLESIISATKIYAILAVNFLRRS